MNVPLDLYRCNLVKYATSEANARRTREAEVGTLPTAGRTSASENELECGTLIQTTGTSANVMFSGFFANESRAVCSITWLFG